MPLIVLIYEGIINKVFDYDYAPVSIQMVRSCPRAGDSAARSIATRACARRF